MIFKAYAINLLKSDFILIKDIVSTVTKENVEIFDLRSYEIESTADDVLFLFGRRAHILGHEKKCKMMIELPEVDKLSKDYGTEEDRKEAYEQLIKFKARLENQQLNKLIDDNSHVVGEDLITEPELDKGKIKDLTYWEGKNKEGKLIRISKKPEVSTADINLTFKEFETLRDFMEVFGIKETKIVYKPSTTIWKNSTTKN